MITGDRVNKAQIFGDQLQLNQVYAEVTPDSKSAIVEQLKASGRTVMFVGDGVNDAPASTMADVGIAMCEGTELARQAADVVLLKNELYGVAETRQLAMSTIQSNIKLTEYIIAASCWRLPWAGLVQQSARCCIMAQHWQCLGAQLL